MSPRLAIAGAGPAGLAAAIAARRLGLDALICERAAGSRRAGGGIFLHSNGQRALAALGLLDGLLPAMRPSRTIAIDWHDGRRLSTFDYGTVPVPHASGAVLLRRDLQEHLLAAARSAGTEVRFGCAAAAADNAGGRTVLRLTSGEEIPCDAVVAADGIDSRLREAAGLAARKSRLGEAYLRGIAAVATPDDAVREIWAPDGRRFGICPLPGERTYFYCSVPPGGWEDILDHGLESWIEGWSGHGPEVLALLRVVADWREAVYDELQEVEVAPWQRAPLFLAGDAAHAMLPNLGQGASSAMVDALVLVRLLARALAQGGDLAAAGRAYEALRRPFVTAVQAASRRLGATAADPESRQRFVDEALAGGMPEARPPRSGRAVLAAGFNPMEEEFLAPFAGSG